MNRTTSTPAPTDGSEYAILRAALDWDHALFPIIRAALPDADTFQQPETRSMWKAMLKVADSMGEKAISQVTVIDMLRRNRGLARGVWANVEEIEQTWRDIQWFRPPLDRSDVEAACKVLQNRWIKRRAHEMAAEAAAQFQREEGDPLELVSSLQGQLDQLIKGTLADESRVVSLMDALYQEGGTVDRLRQRRDRVLKGESPITGLLTGYGALDKLIGGLNEGLYLLGGDTKDGKTSMAYYIGVHVALVENVTVLIHSYEMGPNSLAEKFIIQWLGVHPQDLRYGNYNPEKLKLPADKHERLHNILIHDCVGATPQDLKARLIAENHRLEMADRPPVGLVIVDYLQLVTAGRDLRNMDRHKQVGIIAAQLREIAKQFHVPVLTLSQVGSEGKTRESSEPIMHADAWMRIMRDVHDPSGTSGKFRLERMRDAVQGVEIDMVWRPESLTWRMTDTWHNSPPEKAGAEGGGRREGGHDLEDRSKFRSVRKPVGEDQRSLYNDTGHDEEDTYEDPFES